MTGHEEVRCLLMRGGTSKGAYFLAEDLPADPDARDDLLLRVMGSPDERQIDGLGGAHPLTSKVAVVSPSAAPDADVDYLFLQVAVDRPEVSGRQNCGNILAGVGPFAVERGLVPAGEETTAVRIRMVNSGDLGHAQLFTPDLDASVAFFTDYLGLVVSGRHGDTVYLRTFDDYEHHSLVLTARERPGLGRLALRTSSEEALHRRIRAIEESGGTGTWAEDEPGLGKLYLTTDPDGHEHALYWEGEHYLAPEELRPALKNQPRAKPNRGGGVRRLDHVNFLAADGLANAEFQERVLGPRPAEQIRADSRGVEARGLKCTHQL